MKVHRELENSATSFGTMIVGRDFGGARPMTMVSGRYYEIAGGLGKEGKIASA